jgi:alkylhydroperoxidase domain protein/CMD domain protein
MTDLLDVLAGAGPRLVALRARREKATAHAEGSHRALFEPADPGGVSGLERAAVALRVAAWHEEPRLVDHYRRLLTAAGAAADLVALVETRGGRPPDNARLGAELAHADLLAARPAEATPADLASLAAAGLTERDIVTISQVIAFVSFQARLLAGVLLLADTASERPAPDGLRTRVAAVPRRFTQEMLDWAPWIAPLGPYEADEKQRAALGTRAGSPYFRLLARDAPVLVERTATDVGIFRSEGGLPRAERELAAAVASRVNGCVYCASVHARLASHFSGRAGDVQRLLDEGVTGAQDDRWRLLVDAAAALSQTPSLAGPADIGRLRGAGLSDLEILDLVQATAFFAWANRLMLTLGEPVGAAG